jgi:hypothetical protein
VQEFKLVNKLGHHFWGPWPCRALVRMQSLIQVRSKKSFFKGRTLLLSRLD